MIAHRFSFLASALIGASLAMSSLSATGTCTYDTAVNGEWAPTERQIDDVETRLVMPKGSKQLASYVRYYYGETVRGHRLLMGEFVLEDGQVGVRVVSRDDAPKYLDGGCLVVNLKYDMKQQKVIAIFCNGVG